MPWTSDLPAMSYRLACHADPGWKKSSRRSGSPDRGAASVVPGDDVRSEPDEDGDEVVGCDEGPFVTTVVTVLIAGVLASPLAHDGNARTSRVPTAPPS